MAQCPRAVLQLDEGSFEMLEAIVEAVLRKQT
jgi:hypothetical protein